MPDDIYVEEGMSYTLPVAEYRNTTHENLHVTKWSINNKEYDINDKYYPTGETFLNAVWEDKPLVNVTFEAGTHAHGDTVTKQYPDETDIYIWSDGGNGLEPDEDYVFEQWKVIFNVGAYNEKEIGMNQKSAGENQVHIQGNTRVILNCKEGPRATLTFDANGGTSEMEPVKTPKDKEYELPESTFTPPDGYKFLHWEIYSEKKPEDVITYYPGEKITMNEDRIAKAIWKAIPRVVSFDLNGGEGEMPKVEVEKGETFFLPGGDELTPPAGKKFYKWELPDKSTMIAGESTLIEKDTTFTALWTDAANETCTIYFCGDGEAYESVDVVLSGSKYTLPGCGYKAPEGMKFYKWVVTGLGQMNPGDSITITGETFIDAVWIASNEEHCTVHFYSGDGSGAMDDINIKKGSEYTLPECGFTAPEGKAFDSWLIPDNSKKAPGEKITVNADITVKAEWKTVEEKTDPTDPDNPGGEGGSGGNKPAPDNTVSEDIVPETKDADGKDIKVIVTYSKAVSYNGLKHEWTEGKKKRNTVNDVIINIDNSMSEFAEPVVKFKNNRDANLKNPDNPKKQPYYTISFKAKSGVKDKEKKKTIKNVNKEFKNKKFSFTINQADIGLSSDMDIKVKKEKVTKAAVIIDGRTFKLKKNEFAGVINPDNTVTITATGEKSNFIGVRTK